MRIMRSMRERKRRWWEEKWRGRGNKGGVGGGEREVGKKWGRGVLRVRRRSGWERKRR